MSGFFARLASAAVARRGAVVAATVFVTLIGAVSALRLAPDAGTSTLVDRDSDAFAATERFRDLFGDDAIAVLVRGDLEDLMLTEDLGQLLRLEGCLSGNLPEGGQPAAPVCEEIARAGATQVVYGPATFLNQSVAQANAFLARQLQGGTAALPDLIELGRRYGLTSPPRLDDPRFVRRVVFDSRLPGGVPKARFAYLFPSPESALISVRLRPDLTSEEHTEAIEAIRTAVADDEFGLEGGSYAVSGVPVVVDELAGEFRGEIVVLLAAALAVMAIVLTLVFGPPMRLLPLGLALVAAAVAFGALSLTGGTLTMASVAVLPVLIGLAVDYAIQLQARYREGTGEGQAPNVAARGAAARGGPVIATAALATVAGFLVLLLSPIPMVRGFGVLLVLGIAIAFCAAVTAGLAILSAGGPRGPSPARRWIGIRDPGATGRRLAARRRAAGAALGAVGRRALATSISRPGLVLAVAVALAAGGWVAGTRTEVISDLRELVPSHVLDDAGVDELQAETGVSGELNVLVTAPDITDPGVVEWMGDFKQRVLARGGFGADELSCEDADVCPQIALTDLFAGGGELTRARVRGVLRAIPPYFWQAVVAPDPETGRPGNTANIAFGIRVMPLDEQKRLIDEVRAEIDPPGTADDPPPGTEARLAGLPVLAADANASLADSRYWLTLAGLVAVAAILLAVYRAPGRALAPLIPIALATGWSALVLAVMGIPLNPMSATLGALVIAIATEFSVILSARYREEREGGRTVGEALRRAYTRTGAAVLASGVTAIAGFAVLIVSEIRMLRDFGLVTVVDLGVALVGVMLVLPAALVWIERRAARAPATGGLRRRAASLVPARLARRGARGG